MGRKGSGNKDLTKIFPELKSFHEYLERQREKRKNLPKPKKRRQTKMTEHYEEEEPEIEELDYWGSLQSKYAGMSNKEKLKFRDKAKKRKKKIQKVGFEKSSDELEKEERQKQLEKQKRFKKGQDKRYDELAKRTDTKTGSKQRSAHKALGKHVEKIKREQFESFEFDGCKNCHPTIEQFEENPVVEKLGEIDPIIMDMKRFKGTKILKDMKKAQEG